MRILYSVDSTVFWDDLDIQPEGGRLRNAAAERIWPTVSLRNLSCRERMPFFNHFAMIKVILGSFGSTLFPTTTQRKRVCYLCMTTRDRGVLVTFFEDFKDLGVPFLIVCISNGMVCLQRNSEGASISEEAASTWMGKQRIFTFYICELRICRF